MRIQSIVEAIGSKKRIYPHKLARDLKASVKDVIEVLENHSSYDLILEKWYRIECLNLDCGQFVYGEKFTSLANIIDSAECDHCGSRFPVTPERVGIYFLNKSKKGSNNPQENVSRKKDTPTSYLDYEAIRNEKSEYIFHKSKQLVWHISDLHLTRKPSYLPHAHGHCDKLINIFLNCLKQRGIEKSSKDIFIVSGDLTDTGSLEDENRAKEFLIDLKKLGVNPNNILLVPGNHDAWNGASRPRLFLKYLFTRETKILKNFIHYPARKLPELFNFFEKEPCKIESRDINNCTIDFALINTTVFGAIAKGIFPINIVNKFLNKKRIAVFHHHLLNDLSSTNLGFDHYTNVRSMRVLNFKDALHYIFDNKISIALHGHKHLQYFKREIKQNTTDAAVDIITTPSLSESHYDKINGNYFKSNTIGFNILEIEEKSYKYYFLKLKDWSYRMEHFDKISW